MDEAGRLPEERLAARLQARGDGWRGRAADVLHELAAIDRAVYRAIASTPSPTLDEPIRRLTRIADHSKLWIGAAGAIALFGGRRGRRAALTGLAAIGVTSAVVNLPMKFAAERSRPEREAWGVPDTRWVDMPTSTSFPSGHSASAFAFATAVGDGVPALGGPLRGLAAVVGFSRIHTGVHYPGDVVVGALVGATVGELVSFVSRRLEARRAD